MKTCTRCRTEKPSTEFSSGYRRKDGTATVRAWCKACHRAYSKTHYLETSSPAKRYDGSFDMSLYGKQRLLAFRAWMDRLKAGPCADCGDKFHPAAMDFDHVRGKKAKHISNMWSWTHDKVLEELKKCELVCANCHRVRTYLRRQEHVKEAI